MRPFGLPRELEVYRRTYHGRADNRQNGLLVIPKRDLRVVFSNGAGWEHVSVSHQDRCPSWETMCWVKGKFWDPEAAVVQYHPPASAYVNCHPYCLHLWRPIDVEMLLPSPILVGVILARPGGEPEAA